MPAFAIVFLSNYPHITNYDMITLITAGCAKGVRHSLHMGIFLPMRLEHFFLHLKPPITCNSPADPALWWSELGDRNDSKVLSPEFLNLS